MSALFDTGRGKRIAPWRKTPLCYTTSVVETAYSIAKSVKTFYFCEFELTKEISCDIISVLRKCGCDKPLTFNLQVRGVAKVVSRQFRVLETVGSSPAASTKKTVFDGLFYFVEADEDENPPRALRFVFTCFVADICSHYLRARIGFAFQVKPWGARSPKASDRNIHLR